MGRRPPAHTKKGGGIYREKNKKKEWKGQEGKKYNQTVSISKLDVGMGWGRGYNIEREMDYKKSSKIKKFIPITFSNSNKFPVTHRFTNRLVVLQVSDHDIRNTWFLFLPRSRVFVT